MLEFDTEADSCRGLMKVIASVAEKAVDTLADTIQLSGISGVADNVVVEGICDLARFRWH